MGNKEVAVEKKAHRGRQVIRIIKILRMLEATQVGVTVNDLAKELEVDPRTIFRDINVLEREGFPLERGTSPVGGTRYRIYKEFSRTLKIPFGYSELLSLYYCLRMLKPLEGTPLMAGIDSVIDKIYKTLPARIGDEVEAMGKLVIPRTGPHRKYANSLQTIEQIDRAARERKKCRVTYLVPEREKADKHIYHPYATTFYGGALYTIGWSELRKAMRTFAVHRIQLVEVLNETFDVPKDFSAEEFLDQSFGVSHDGEIEEVVLRFSRKEAPRIMEREWHPTQKIVKLPDGRIEMTLCVTGRDDLYCWLMPMGKEVTVVKPRRLRDLILASCRETLDHYRTNAGGKNGNEEKK